MRFMYLQTHRTQDFEALHHTLVQAWATYTDAVDAFALAISSEPPSLPVVLSQPAWSEAALAHWAASAECRAACLADCFSGPEPLRTALASCKTRANSEATALDEAFPEKSFFKNSEETTAERMVPHPHPRDRHLLRVCGLPGGVQDLPAAADHHRAAFLRQPADRR
jgi:hypothetical protein